MVRAEQDRAALMVSETAALVEVFLLHHASRARTLAAQLRTNRQFDVEDAGKSVVAIPRNLPSAEQFDAFWLVDSLGGVRALSVSQTSDADPQEGVQRGAQSESTFLSALREARRATPGHPFITVGNRAGRPTILFGEAVGGDGRTILVGGVAVDTLLGLLRRQQHAKSFGIRIASPGDTIVDVPPTISEQRYRTVRDSVVTPTGETWPVTMMYAPSSRGVRIALWVVGLGAVVGLGIGLLLERREISRIADRSSELEHLSAELLRANRAKSEFLANVSHELRTPLNAIVGFVDLLRDGVYGALNARQVGPVERIEVSANHLRHLVDQVLDLAKMAAGRLEVHTEPLELRPFVFDVASEIEPLITEKGLSFSLAVGASLPRVRTDPTHLRQILINLLGNAVKFTNTGTISIRGKLVGVQPQEGLSTLLPTNATLRARSPRPDQLWIALQVVDTGVGISEKDRERIFDEFEQVNAGPRGDSMKRGTGLGLSISRRLARLLGGDITVESELDRGSVFTVWLPVDPADLRGDRAA